MRPPSAPQAGRSLSLLVVLALLTSGVRAQQNTPSPFINSLFPLPDAASFRAAIGLGRVDNRPAIRRFDAGVSSADLVDGGGWIYLGPGASHLLDGPDTGTVTLHHAGTGDLRLVNSQGATLHTVKAGDTVAFAIVGGVFRLEPRSQTSVLGRLSGGSGDLDLSRYRLTLPPNVAGLVPASVGLDRVQNTSDADKPVSLATAAALAQRQPADPDLSALAALTTRPFGRSLLETADSTAFRRAVGLNSELQLAPVDAQTGAFRIVNLGAHEDDEFPTVPSLVARDNGIVFLARNLVPDRTKSSYYSLGTTGTASMLACGGEGMQFGTAPFAAAGSGVPPWHQSWQMAIDARDGSVRMLNRLALGVVFNWSSWRTTEALHVRGRAGSDLAEFIRESDRTTGYANTRLTHETSAAATAIGDGLGSSLVFAIRGREGTGLPHVDLVALDGIRSDSNASGAFVVRTRDRTGIAERLRVTPGGMVALGTGPMAQRPALKARNEILQVRRGDDSDLGALECFTMPPGTSGKSAATTEFVQTEIGARASAQRAVKGTTLSLPAREGAVHLTGAGARQISAVTGGQTGRTYTLVNLEGGDVTLNQTGNLRVRGGGSLVVRAKEACSLHVIDATTGLYTVW